MDIARHRLPRLARAGLALLAVAASLAVGAGPAGAAADEAVFTISNDPAGNEVLVFARAADGTLSPAGSVATGGRGNGAGLGSQGSVTLSDDGRWLFAVNAGSNSVSVFAVDGTDLTLTDVKPTRGETPASVDVHGNLVYVLNAGSDSVQGYRFVAGRLEPKSSARRPLSGRDVGGAQVEFSPDGSSLAVTEKATNLITAFRVSASGGLSPGRSTAAAGETPFGFEFDPAGRLVVSEAFGGAPGASALSAYAVGPDRGITTLDGPVGTTQTAACWVAISADGAHVYTTNTGSGTVSRYALASDGTLDLVDHTPTGAGPADVDLSGDGGALYVLNGAGDSISVFAVAGDGALTPIQTLTGLPAPGAGIAAG